MGVVSRAVRRLLLLGLLLLLGSRAIRHRASLEKGIRGFYELGSRLSRRGKRRSGVSGRKQMRSRRP